jgi:polyvinyl alcohol dehydrogenase (cytochrome)
MVTRYWRLRSTGNKEAHWFPNDATAVGVTWTRENSVLHRLLPASLIAALLGVSLQTAAQTAPDDKGMAIFAQRCTSCHDMAGGRAPATFFLKRRLPSEIIYALTKGAMRAQAAGLSAEDIDTVARSLTGREIDRLPPADANMCTVPGKIATVATEWASWGQNVHNTRFQTEPGLTAADLPRLKVKWAFALPGLTGAPTVAGDYLFVSSLMGKVFALDAKTGCTRWSFDAGSPVRNGVAVGLLPDGTYGAFFGDQNAVVHALDAATGKPIWTLKTDDYGNARIVGSVTFHKGVVYAPTTSADEVEAYNPAYECCKFRGSVTAIDAATGKRRWKAYAIQEAPHPTRKNDAGTQMYGPSGVGIWSAPTIDEKRGLVYAATGDAYTTDIPTDASDAVVAFEIKTGKRVWVSQVLKGDAWIYGCDGKTAGNCPTPQGPDHDFSSPPLLTTMADGKDILVSGSKSGMAWAFDPDDKGKVLWSTAVGKGSTAYPIWGVAADAERAYVAMPTLALTEGKDGGFSAIDLKTGKIVWHTESPAQTFAWGSVGCQHKQTAAVTLIPGIALAGSMDAHLRAYDTRTGDIVWDYDSAQTFDAVNGVKAYGGNLDGAPQIVANGTLFLSSGNSALPSPHHGDAVLAITVDGK